MTTDPIKLARREAIARIIDPAAVDWKEPWRHRTGFYATNKGPHRQAAIERDEDNERQKMFEAIYDAMLNASPSPKEEP
jgi:hypothetical protein